MAGNNPPACKAESTGLDSCLLKSTCSQQAVIAMPLRQFIDWNGLIVGVAQAEKLIQVKEFFLGAR